MTRTPLLIIVVIAVLSSCNQNGQSSSESLKSKELNAQINATDPKSLTSFDEKYVDTKYIYTDASGSNLTIQNSFPKSGIHYTAPSGKKYIYAVFWTRIVNETDYPFRLNIDFPAELSALPSDPDFFYRLLIPPDTMRADKIPLYDYGLTNIKSFLDSNLTKPSSFTSMTGPKESSAFYVITLSEEGVNGPLRTGFSLKGQDIYYSINKNPFHCGTVNRKDLILKSDNPKDFQKNNIQ